MIVPDEETLWRQGEGFIFRWLYLYSDSHRASLGGYTFTLILWLDMSTPEMITTVEVGGGFNF